MNIALILSGGIGSRMGFSIPKQYIEVGNKPIISYCIERFLVHQRIDKIQIVADLAWRDMICKWMEKDGWEKKFQGFSAPGENRQLSILHGLEDIKTYANETDYVIIHDAARPLLSEKLISECLDKAIGHEGVLPVLQMKDTIYFSNDGERISSLLNRQNVFAGQAPEVFQMGAYYRANLRLLPDQILQMNGSTEPAFLAGMDMVMISGEEGNFKITTKADLDRFRSIIENKGNCDKGLYNLDA